MISTWNAMISIADLFTIINSSTYSSVLSHIHRSNKKSMVSVKNIDDVYNNNNNTYYYYFMKKFSVKKIRDQNLGLM